MTAILHYLNQTLHTSNNGGMPTLELPPIVDIDGVGVLVFDKELNWLTYEEDSSFELGTNDFTIEFWVWAAVEQWNFPRLFSFGSYPSASIAISIEDDGYFWINGSYRTFNPPQYKTWTHIAIVRQNDTVYLYKNGVQEIDWELSPGIDIPLQALTIGNESDSSEIASLLGCITNFRIVNGTAVYTATFTPPSTNITAIPGTILLLNATSANDLLLDSSNNNFIPNSNSNISWRKSSPLLSA